MIYWKLMFCYFLFDIQLHIVDKYQTGQTHGQVP